MKELKINNKEYRIDSITAKRAYELLATIISLTGSAAEYLPALLQNVEEEAEGFSSDIISFAAASEMISKNGVGAFIELKDHVISMAEIKSESGSYNQVDLDRDFVGDLNTAEKLFDAIIEEHLSPLLKGGSGTSPAALAVLLIRNLFRTQS